MYRVPAVIRNEQLALLTSQLSSEVGNKERAVVAEHARFL